MPDTSILSRRALSRAALARQMLLQREKVKVAAAVERLAGMQAQVPRPPFVGLWTRIDGFARADLTRAIEKHEVVRATMMRGTLHLVSRKDFLTLRMALQPMLTKGMQAILRDRAKGLDVEAITAEAQAFFRKEPRTFAELREHLDATFPKSDERAMGYISRMMLPLIMIPADGAEWAYPATADFAVAESWLGASLDPKDNAQALALRYFAAFGPASARDFQTWSGVPNAAAIVDALRPKLTAFRDERKRELFDLPKAPRTDESADAPVRFLPEFDSLLLAYADRTRIVADEHKPALASRNLFVPATFLVDGFMSGTWTYEVKKKVARLVLKPVATLPKPVRAALTEEGERLLAFLEPDAAGYEVSM